MALAVDGLKIRELRERETESQARFSERAGIADYTLQRAERGEGMSRLTVRKIANALDVDWLELLTEEERERQQEEAGSLKKISPKGAAPNQSGLPQGIESGEKHGLTRISDPQRPDVREQRYLKDLAEERLREQLQRVWDHEVNPDEAVRELREEVG